MATATAYAASGEKTGTAKLPDGLFGIEPNAHVVWEAVVNYLANQRQGTVKVQTRGEVSLSNSKPWRQKGTGRARAGTWRSPLWVGGGRIHGPKPRDHSYRLPKKVRRLALKSALSDRAKAGRVAVIDSIDLTEPKTKVLWSLLAKMELGERKVLLLTDELTEALALSARNIPTVLALSSREVNTYSIVAADWIVLTKKGLAKLEEVFT
jgi:large subunit ribosomal protein L4